MLTKAQKKKREKLLEKRKNIVKIAGIVLCGIIGVFYLKNMYPAESKSENVYLTSDNIQNETINEKTNHNLSDKSNYKNNNENINLNNKSFDASNRVSNDKLNNNSNTYVTNDNNTDYKAGDNISEKNNNFSDISNSTFNSNDGIININTATVQELCALKGIGEKRAQDIINYRNSAGGFSCIEEIMNVKGIKQGVFSKIKDFIKVED